MYTHTHVQSAQEEILKWQEFLKNRNYKKIGDSFFKQVENHLYEILFNEELQKWSLLISENDGDLLEVHHSMNPVNLSEIYLNIVTIPLSVKRRQRNYRR